MIFLCRMRTYGKSRIPHILVLLSWLGLMALLSNRPGQDNDITVDEMTSTPVIENFHYKKNSFKAKISSKSDLKTIDQILLASEGYFPIAYQEDPVLIAFVRGKLRSPSPPGMGYNLDQPDQLHFSQYNQSLFVNNLLNGMRNGTFVELGAFNGEHHSNTLYLERELNWTGLLIEPHPMFFGRLMKKGRKAFAINAGASKTNMSAVVQLKLLSAYPEMSYIADEDMETSPSTVSIKTYPLYSMLAASNIAHIDFLSLDVEGDELLVLKTIPWDKITVLLMCVEYVHIEGRAPAVVNFMQKHGYILLNIEDYDIWLAHKTLLERHLGHKLTSEKVSVLFQ